MEKKYGSLIVRSEPSDAIVSVDDVVKTTPAIFDLKGRSPPYKVKIEKTGYDDYMQSVVIRNGSKIEMDIKLKKV